jgi:hypothetical protein
MSEEKYRKEVELYMGHEVSPEEIEEHRQRGLTPEQTALMLKLKKKKDKRKLRRLV